MRIALFFLIATTSLLSVPLEVGAQVQFEFIREIGVELGPEEYSFGSVVGVAVSAMGDVYVLDGMAKRVRVYDRNGRYLRAFGREGSGPGEFQLPGRMLIVRDEVWIFDPRLQRFTAFSEDGEVIRTVRVPDHLGGVDLAAPLKGGLWLGVKNVTSLRSDLVTEIFRANPSERSDHLARWRTMNESVLIVVRPDQHATADTLFRWDPGSIPYFGEGGVPFGFISRNWGSGGSWALGGDSILVTLNQHDGALRVWRVADGRLMSVRSGRLGITPAPVTDADMKRLEAAERQRQPQRLPRNVMFIPPRWKAQLGSPIVSTDGSVWIPRSAPDPTMPPGPPSRSYLIVPIDGSAQQQVMLPSGFRLLLVQGDLLVGTRRTDNDVAIVQIWRMR